MHEHCMMIVQDHWDTIVRAYLDFEEKKPIILLDMQKHKIYAYPYQDFVEKYRDDWSVFGKLDHYHDGLFTGDTQETGVPSKSFWEYGNV